MAELKQIVVPDLGGQGEIPVVELLVAVGDAIQADQAVATLESDKATLEVPAPFAGIVRQVKVAPGERVSAGSLVALIEVAADAEMAAPTAMSAATPEPQAKSHGTKSAALTDAAIAAREATPIAHLDGSDAPAHASPAVRKLARELGVDLGQVVGTHRAGRISTEDVQRHIKSILSRFTGAETEGAPDHPASAPPPGRTIDFTRFGEVEIKPLSRIRRLSGAHLTHSWSSIPHVTQHESADITELEKLRVMLNGEQKSSGIKVTMLAFLLKASAAALKAFPQFNASLAGAGGDLVLKKYFHIGFATDTDEGLLVPVIRDVERKGVLDLAREIADLAAKARSGKLSLAQMSGASFSISSLGGIGGTGFTPLVNPPEVAILGVSKARLSPVWCGNKFEPRLMLPLSLSYDHRVIDGALAARFATFLADVLADLRRLLL